MKWIISRLQNLLGIAVLAGVLALIAWDGSPLDMLKGLNAAAKDKPAPPSPEQLAQRTCLEPLLKAHIFSNVDFTEREVELMKADQSTIPLAIERRRSNEKFCLEKAKCLTSDVTGLGILFDSCLLEAENVPLN